MLNWIKDWTKIDIDIILTFDECQFYFMNKEDYKYEWATLFFYKPYLANAIKIKAPKIADWIESLSKIKVNKQLSSLEVRETEIKLMKNALQDFIVYCYDPDIYDKLSFNSWDESELTSLTDFKNKRVIDIGSGSGKQVFAVAGIAKTVYSVEPVSRLREYIKNRAASAKYKNVFVVDGFLQHIPFEDSFADILTTGHVFGDFPEEELKEMLRVVKNNGMIILIPGNSDKDNEKHKWLLSKGFSFDRFLEPGDDYKRKYWLTVKK